ncbi:cytochrome P450 family protein [Heterostelium album PN500]|uniref:Cytochrome P450 family protein n=1 Tax=Heterostelium pallidum (strain ATCC 26659 / Pp 5 / PN500) TaxID=670386 RepID=D3BR82_HETP5|nr:cytochrome P450 family protein [Heterostelium album PN500]EFA75914.1 cytochrome P450 family protein [Heterostelium album PN500]|eukprot:XP_020428048.1 cytochrome P450 family protein [Heterostelium album PN500]
MTFRSYLIMISPMLGMNIILFILLLLVLFVLKSFVDKNKRFSKKDPKRFSKIEWPFLGSIHKITKLPYRAYNDAVMSEDGDGKMLSLWLGDRYTIVVSDPVIIKEIWSKNFQSFSGRYKHESATLISGNYNNLLSGDFHAWQPLRAIVSSAFTKSKIRSMNTKMEDHTVLLIESMKEFQKSNQPFYPERLFKKYTMNVVLAIIFSKTLEENNDGIINQIVMTFKNMLRMSSQGTMENYVKIMKPLLIRKRNTILSQLEICKSYIRDIYNEHIVDFDPENPRDLFDIVIGENPESVERIIRVALDLLLAGSDTSAATMIWFGLYMINYPDVQEKIANELKQLNINKINLMHKPNTPYTMAVLKEVLRIRPIAPLGLTRSNEEDMEICGYFIPKRTQILMNIFSVHHNPKYWPNPEEFNPDRFMTEESTTNYHDIWIPFGTGPRNCVASNLAIDEIYIAISNIILNFKLTSSTGSPADDTEVYGTTIHPKPYGIHLEQRNLNNN